MADGDEPFARSAHITNNPTKGRSIPYSNLLPCHIPEKKKTSSDKPTKRPLLHPGGGKGRGVVSHCTGTATNPVRSRPISSSTVCNPAQQHDWFLLRKPPFSPPSNQITQRRGNRKKKFSKNSGRRELTESHSRVANLTPCVTLTHTARRTRFRLRSQDRSLFYRFLFVHDTHATDSTNIGAPCDAISQRMRAARLFLNHSLLSPRTPQTLLGL